MLIVALVQRRKIIELPVLPMLPAMYKSYFYRLFSYVALTA